MRILVVEDERKVARFLERGLKEEGFVVDVAHDGEEGLRKALENGYDLIALDVLMPKKDGFQTLAELRAANCKSRVIMLTARDSVNDRVHGLETGADDYLTKPFAFAELLARVRALLRRGTESKPDALSLADLRLDARTHRADRAGKDLQLTAKEFAVLQFLLEHAVEVVTRTRLAESVWDENYDPFSNVIDVTIHHLREKVDMGFDSPLIHTVRGRGYVIKEEP